jgi:hypothetical protein
MSVADKRTARRRTPEPAPDTCWRCQKGTLHRTAETHTDTDGVLVTRYDCDNPECGYSEGRAEAPA